MRKNIKDESIDLCYIDPPFNSQRNYNQIYNNIGTEDFALAQAFTDTWIWDANAIAGYDEILDNAQGRFTPQTVELIKGLRQVLREGSLLAYVISLTLRITEIQRVLKKEGSFFYTAIRPQAITSSWSSTAFSARRAATSRTKWSGSEQPPTLTQSRA